MQGMASFFLQDKLGLVIVLFDAVVVHKKRFFFFSFFFFLAISYDLPFHNSFPSAYLKRRHGGNRETQNESRITDKTAHKTYTTSPRK